ncbi:uncharacterized protein LOC113557856 [Rhopalosiphum maidis]|uniref:uncharacterized protein LOC113557856 n=1 Tax=Rhopalosiphum maidis TaxID=43146 RepID=UPI000EFF18C1|nr:uncharacterized protein LOC113557856 [Rhopalosiphum maidis]
MMKNHVQQHPIKFSLKLEATYNRSNVPNSSENRVFKTSAVEVFSESNIAEIIERAYIKLLTEKEAYTSRGSGFTLESIDGLLLTVYKYTPMDGSSYIPLPAYIDRKRGTINPQNVDQQCFKWAVLAKHVTGPAVNRIGENYRQHEDKYNFNGISFPTPLSDVKKFEYNNPTVSVNVYGLDKKFQPPRKYPTYEVYPLLATHYNLCKIEFTPPSEILYRKTADHCHLTGKYRQALCNVCNQKLQTPVFVPCYFHNLSNYDAHLIVTELGYDTQTIRVIPNTEEKYISFSKYVSSKFQIRFIDTFRFMASGLSTLAKNLVTPGLENFRETAKVFNKVDMSLVTRKGVYPYEYTDSWSRLDEERLPRKRDFYSTLNESGIKEEEYTHAKEVWDHFGCKTLGEYSDLYLKIDVLLLADVLENFRDVCLKTYNLDAAYYFTAPGLSFDAMLKFTGKKLELLSDYDMLLMYENGIRGGLVQASMRHAKANNIKTPDYDETKEKSWLIYQDCNNLYGWAMCQYMPYGDFNWVESNLNELSEMSPTSDKGRVYEIDVSYPQHLHDKHNDLPLLPQNGIPSGSKVKKLMSTFKQKKNYIIHYRNLQQAIENGLIVEKVHRVLEFSQSAWLADYINLNTEMRKKAQNDFEKDFFKLMNNAVFGKTMQSKRKEMKMELVSCERRLQKLINKTTFKHATNYNENLNAVALENKIIKFDKPIYIGFAVLDIYLPTST